MIRYSVINLAGMENTAFKWFLLSVGFTEQNKPEEPEPAKPKPYQKRKKMKQRGKKQTE